MKTQDQEMNKQGGGKGSEMEHLYPHEKSGDGKPKHKPEERPRIKTIAEEDGGKKSR